MGTRRSHAVPFEYVLVRHVAGAQHSTCTFRVPVSITRMLLSTQSIPRTIADCPTSTFCEVLPGTRDIPFTYISNAKQLNRYFSWSTTHAIRVPFKPNRHALQHSNSTLRPILHYLFSTFYDIMQIPFEPSKGTERVTLPSL